MLDADDYVELIEDHRRRKDAFFASDPSSPLTPAQLDAFEGLAYFPVDRALRIVGELIPDPERASVELQTTGGELQPHRRAGTVSFSVDGAQAIITLFEAEDGGFFVPFRDATSGRETYGAGRYLEVRPVSEGSVTVDFNLAYNPYCAYNPHWTCPVPPAENWLEVSIRGGERSFPGAPE